MMTDAKIGPLDPSAFDGPSKSFYSQRLFTMLFLVFLAPCFFVLAVFFRLAISGLIGGSLLVPRSVIASQFPLFFKIHGVQNGRQVTKSKTGGG